MSTRQGTLVSTFVDTIANYGDEPALLVFANDSFRPITWNQIASDVQRYAAALADLKVKPGDRVVHISENRREWVLLDLAIHLCRAVHVALHSSLTGKQLAEQIVDCEPSLIVVSCAAQVAKLESVADSLPKNVPIVSHDVDCGAVAGRPIRSLDEVSSVVDLASGKQLQQDALENTTPDSLATILYTSGTTGEPKGVMLSHGNLTSNVRACIDASTEEGHKLRLCWLPLSHIYARTSDLYVWLTLGSQLALARSRETLLPDLAMVKPTYVNGVPYFYDKIARNLCDAGKGDTPGVVGHVLGGRIAVCCAGGAALSDETARFFERQGTLLVQGYGLTESSPVICTGTREAHRLGTVGRPVPGVEVRIADDGEILTRGPHVMQGYWRKPQVTAEVIRDGWLHTGDLGFLEDGYLTVTGRKKEILVLTSGKNVARALIERLLCDDPLIAQAIVFGDSRNYLTALIVPEPDHLKSQVSALNLQLSSPAEALTYPNVVEIFRKRIDERLADLSPQEQVAKFKLLGRGFTIEQDELTPTLKLRRKQIAEHFADAIAAMY